MQVFFSISLLLWAFILNFFQKHFNILIILLINTYCLGFVDKDNFGILNKFDINALCLIIYIFIIIFNFSFARLKQSKFKFHLLVILSLYIFGVLYPYYQGNSSLFWSIKEGKEYIHYLGFFALFLSVRKDKDIKRGWQYILILSFYYGLLQIAYILGAYKFEFLHYLYRKDFDIGIMKVYQPIFVIIFIAMFYYLWKTVLMGSKSYLQLIFLFATGMLTAFRSYILGSFIAIGFCFLTLFRGKEFYKLLAVYSIIIVMSIGAFSITLSGSMTERFVSTFDTYIISGIREFINKEGGSLAGRKSINKFRWEYFNKQPLLGYGFIDKKSKLGTEVYRKHNREFAMIDTGYLDVLMKFGIIGSIVFYGIFLHISLTIIKMVKAANEKSLKVKGTVLLSFIITLLAAQVTHGGLTFSFGIVPLYISLALFDCEYANREKSKINK